MLFKTVECFPVFFCSSTFYVCLKYLKVLFVAFCLSVSRIFSSINSTISSDTDQLSLTYLRSHTWWLNPALHYLLIFRRLLSGVPQGLHLDRLPFNIHANDIRVYTCFIHIQFLPFANEFWKYLKMTIF